MEDMGTGQTRPRHPKAALYCHLKLFDNLTTFRQLEERIAHLSTEQERGNAFEVFVEAYLSTQPLYQAKILWPFSAIPITLKEQFALWHRDVGVDGLFETHLGDFHAYQAKFRKGRPALTWKELSTFMGLTDQIAERVVITNCEEFSSVMNDRRGFYAIRGTDLDRTQAEDFEAIRTWLVGSVVKHKRKTPLARQQEALDAILSTLKEQDRTTVLMPCGTGKTLVALWAAEQLGGSMILVLVPSLALMNQTVHEWLKETRWPNPSFLCVCSDHTVASRADALVLYQADVDFPVTTERAQVQTFLRRKTEGVKIIFSTYQSSHIVAAGMENTQRFEFGIFDEAHKTAGLKGRRFGFALEDCRLPIAKRLFMTATPRHYDVRSRDAEGEAQLVYSMDEPSIYGAVAYSLSFAQAVEDGMICGYKVLISVVTSNMVNEDLLQHATVLIEQDEIRARQVANQLALKNAIQKYGISKIITFHNSVAAATSFTTQGPEGIGKHLPTFQTLHVNGKMATGKRVLMMRAFAEGERTLISNARCLTEGIDIPAVDMVAFLTPKRSLVDIVQATGRAMRKSDQTNKTTGYILVPLFLDQTAGQTIEEALAHAEFEEVWTVLQALQEHDEVLADCIRQMRVARGKRKGVNEKGLRERIEVIGPSVSLDLLQRSITTRIVDRMGTQWDERFGELLAYKELHSHCRTIFNNPDLQSWVSQQRRIQERGLLSKERKSRLDSIGFDWRRRGPDRSWENGLDALTEYKERHGNCNVPWNSPEAYESYGHLHDIATWVAHQRSSRALKTLSADKERLLEALGFGWEEKEDDWQSAFWKLSEFARTHGHCGVPQNGHPELKLLANWMSHQQQLHRQGVLAPEKVSKLETLPQVWNDWDQYLHRNWSILQEFRHENGHCNVPRYREEFESTFGILEGVRALRWKLSAEWMSRFDSLGITWDSDAAIWEELLSELQTLQRRDGPCPAPCEKYPIVMSYCRLLNRPGLCTYNVRSETEKEVEKLLYPELE